MYLARHARAVEAEAEQGRPLSEEGRRQARTVARRLADRGVAVARIYHSPKLRAAQTARILGRCMEPAPVVMEADGLLPGDDPELWAARLGCMGCDVMLVGHLPHLGALAAFLAGGALAGAPWPEAAVLCLHREGRRRWRALWTVTADERG